MASRECRTGSHLISANGVGVRIAVILFWTGLLGVAMACNGGYKIRVKKIENCAGTDAIITADQNFSVVLTKNCDIKTRGCVRFKDFKTGNAKYTISKDGVQVMQGSTDICDQASRPRRTENIAELLRGLGVPEKCPIEAGQICTEPSQVVNINRFKQYLPLARGAIAVDVAVQHDSKDGFSIKVNKVENCAGADGIITLSEDTAVTLQDDCSLSLKGCVNLKAFNTAAGTVSVSKNGKEMFKKQIDACKMGKKIPFIDSLPGGVCPQSDNDFCADPSKKLPMERFKKMMGIMKGTLGIEVNLDHDTNGGYQMVIHSIENCAGEGQIVTIDPKSTVTLMEDCTVMSKATARTVGFKTAEMEVTITKNGLPVLKENVDICANLEEASDNKEAAEIITMFGVPDHCPVAASEVRTDESQTYSLEKYKQHLLVAQGRSIIDVLVKHDKGESCFKIDLEVIAPNLIG
uniref:Uncharacterized protein n=1 Tax=Anopheles epiroticus TaxID=199890 RepID=A0A182P0I7_9DIPT